MNISWKKPRGLQDDSGVSYKYSLLKDGKDVEKVRKRVTCFCETLSYPCYTDSLLQCMSLCRGVSKLSDLGGSDIGRPGQGVYIY